MVLFSPRLLVRCRHCDESLREANLKEEELWFRRALPQFPCPPAMGSQGPLWWHECVLADATPCVLAGKQRDEDTNSYIFYAPRWISFSWFPPPETSTGFHYLHRQHCQLETLLPMRDPVEDASCVERDKRVSQAAHMTSLSHHVCATCFSDLKKVHKACGQLCESQ